MRRGGLDRGWWPQEAPFGALALVPALDAVVTVGSAPWAMANAPWTTDPWLAFEANVPSASFGGLSYGPLTVDALPVGLSLLVAAVTLAAIGAPRLPGRPVVAPRLGAPLGLIVGAAAAILLVVAAGASFVVLALTAVAVALALALALALARSGPFARSGSPDGRGDDWWLSVCAAPLVVAVGLALAAPGLGLAVAAAVAVGAGAMAALERPRAWAHAIAGVPALLAAAPLTVLVLFDADVDRARPAVMVAGVVGGSVALVVAAVGPRLDERLRVVVGAWGVVGIGAASTLSATVWAQDRWSLVVAVAALAAVALLVAWRGRDERVALGALAAAPVLVATVAGLATLAGRWSPEVALVSAALVGAVALAAGPHWWHGVHRSIVGASGGLTIVVAAGLLAEGAFPWPGDGAHALAVVLTLATASLAVAGAAPGWRLLEGAAAAVGVAATWAWLGVAEVSVVEAYTLPAAVVAGCAGWWQRRRDPSTSSWLAYGPALVVGLGPSLVLSLDGDGGRSVAVALACLVALVVGAEGRLQAPLALGSFGLVVLALDTVGPVAAQVPRWVVLAVAGVVSLWLGATIERRLGQARSWFDRFGHLR